MPSNQNKKKSAKAKPVKKEPVKKDTKPAKASGAGKASKVSITPSLSVSRVESPPDPLEPPETGGALHTCKSSVMVIFTVVEAVFPELSVIE